jgi:hypothetical protein
VCKCAYIRRHVPKFTSLTLTLHVCSFPPVVFPPQIFVPRTNPPPPPAPTPYTLYTIKFMLQTVSSSMHIYAAVATPSTGGAKGGVFSYCGNSRYCFSEEREDGRIYHSLSLSRSLVHLIFVLWIEYSQSLCMYSLTTTCDWKRRTPAIYIKQCCKIHFNIILS